MQIVPSTWLTYDSVVFKYKAGSTAIINLVTMKSLIPLQKTVRNRPCCFGVVISEGRDGDLS